MKRFVACITLLLMLFLTTSCSAKTRQDEVLGTVGKYESKQLWTHGKFQDYTEFGLYGYSSVDLSKNQYFEKIAEADVETIAAYVDNFEEWVNIFKENNPNDELVVNYAFDRSIIDTEDYFYIYGGENRTTFDDYDLWFFDVQTNVLYYFHNNI